MKTAIVPALRFENAKRRLTNSLMMSAAVSEREEAGCTRSRLQFCSLGKSISEIYAYDSPNNKASAVGCFRGWNEGKIYQKAMLEMCGRMWKVLKKNVY